MAIFKSKCPLKKRRQLYFPLIASSGGKDSMVSNHPDSIHLVACQLFCHQNLRNDRLICSIFRKKNPADTMKEVEVATLYDLSKFGKVELELWFAEVEGVLQELN